MLSSTSLFSATNYSAWVYPASSGRLLQKPDALGNRVLDYSNVGYKGGTVALPQVPVKITVGPVDGDDGATIQAAIDQVKAMALDTNGFRGAVLLSAGEYQISNSITINASGIVLRGVGDDTGGTVLRATGTNQRSLIKITGSGSASTVSGTTHNITNNYVPVGGRSFNVDSTSGLSAGDRVYVRRLANTNWIHDLGMDLLDNPWTPSGYNIDSDRIITRIEGNRIMLDAPITCAIEQQYGAGTIREYTWPGRIQNVGVEYLRGVSDYVAADDENHGWILVQINSTENAWVRGVTSQYFGYACVGLYSGTKSATVVDCKSLDPVSIVTGGRRYAFVLDDCQLCLVQNCYTTQDRHQFVTQSLTTGPNVFVDGLSDSARSDAGPHHRWGTGALWDAVVVNGNAINVQNRGNLGSGHGWAGANEVLWNCSASSGYVVQNPPTAHNWLIGSIGSIKNGSSYVGPHDPGTYDSHGSNVFPNSLYFAQLQDRLAAPGLQTREYWLGDIDDFVGSGSTGDVVAVDSTWRGEVQAAAGGASLSGFDSVASGQWIPFTFTFTLGANERVVAATLALSMRASSGDVSNEVLYLDSVANGFTFGSLGWLPIATGTNTTVHTLDLSGRLDLLADGKLNIALQNDVGIDWAMLELQVAPIQSGHTNSMTPAADAYVRGGVSAALNFGNGSTLTVKEDSSGDNDRQSYLRWDLSGVSGKVFQARVRLMPITVGTNGLEQGVTLVRADAWGENSVTWNNQPGGGKRFASWMPAVGVPVEFVVTPQVQEALEGDKQLSLQIFSLRNVGGAGGVDYGSREHPDPASRPQLLLVMSNSLPPTVSTILNRTFAEDGTTGAIPFTVGDDQTAPSNLVVTANSSNTNLVPASNLVLGGSEANRFITVTPAANQTGVTQITVSVSDGMTATTISFQVTVLAVNDAPVLTPIADRNLNVGTTLLITNVALDVEAPPQTLSFALVNAPTGAVIGSDNGVFGWRPGVAQSGTSNLITISVSDNGSPSLSATQSFAVIVNPLAPATVNASNNDGDVRSMVIAGQFGPDYSIQASTNLLDWITVFTTNSPLLPFEWVNENVIHPHIEFYRVLLGP